MRCCIVFCVYSAVIVSNFSRCFFDVGFVKFQTDLSAAAVLMYRSGFGCLDIRRILCCRFSLENFAAIMPVCLPLQSNRYLQRRGSLLTCSISRCRRPEFSLRSLYPRHFGVPVLLCCPSDCRCSPLFYQVGAARSTSAMVLIPVSTISNRKDRLPLYVSMN